MVSKINGRKGIEGRTEDSRNGNGLDVLCAGFVCVSCEVGNVEAERSVVTENTVQICSISQSTAKGCGRNITYCQRTPMQGRSHEWSCLD
jgi:hypothetical protein